MITLVENAEKQPKVFLDPCSGRKRLGIPKGHVYKVRIDRISQGFLPLNEAMKKYPNAINTGSDTLCHSCREDIKKESQGN